MRGKWEFGPDGQVKKEGEEEISLPKIKRPLSEITNVEKGIWTIGEEGRLIPWIEKVKPISPQIRIDIFDEPMVSNADGKVYRSKKALRQSYKDHGYTEVGDQIAALHKMAERRDPFTDPEYQKQLEEDIEKSRNEVKYGDAPLTELEKELCKRQNEAIKRGE